MWKEKDMNIAEKSLRFLVEKWLAPTPTMRIRVVQSGRMGLHKRRYVRVEASAATGSRAIFSFGTMTARGVCFRLRSRGRQ
jgi:hypothetical protein